MILKSSTSLAIDISPSRISAVLLKNLGSQVRLEKTAQVDLPDTAITDGNITDTALLAESLKKLLAAGKFGTKRAAISLTAQPILMQILELPEDMPPNLGRFVHSEIKHSALLAGREAAYDFCGLCQTPSDPNNRILVTAISRENISMLLKALNQAGIEPETITPAAIASLEAI